ncbi:hypothetical protein Taro_043046 [Colocasia esculenta]|uniref:Uncharacterized protein n=1 Tax=Colocasia esculenta TaxID=4460 RepID=A0A843WR46_COLES|nr:hypothetical protein [Colocasia esculenta]
MVGVSVCAPGQGVPLGPSGGNAAGCLPVFTDRSFSSYAVCVGVGRRPFCRLFLEGMPCMPALAGLVVTVTWDPQPRASVEEVLQAAGILKQVRRGAAALPGCSGCVVLCCDSLASLYQGGCRQESATACTVVVAWSCLVSVGLVGLTLLAVLSGFRSAGSLGVSSGVCRGVASVLCLSPLVLRESFCFRLLEFLLLWLVASSPAGSECVAAAAGGVCCECGCCFARAAVGFVLRLRIYVGVSRRLREPTCGVAFTGARCLNTLHQTLGDEFTSFWGRVEEFLAAGEQEIVHTKPFFFPVASAATSTDSHLGVDQRLRCIAWLPCVLVQFSRTVGCCPSDVHSQDCSGLVSAGCCATSGLRTALGMLGGGSPQSYLVLFWLSLLSRWRGAVVVTGQTVLITIYLGIFGQGAVPLTMYLAVVLSRLSSCPFLSFPAALVGLCVSPWSGGWLCFRTLWTLPDGGLVSTMGVWLVVLMWKCQSRFVVFPYVWKRLIVRVSFPCFPLVARGGGAGRAVGAVFSHCGDLYGEGPSSCVVSCCLTGRGRAICPVFSVRQHQLSVVWLARASIVSVDVFRLCLSYAWRHLSLFSVWPSPLAWWERCLVWCASKSQRDCCALEAAGSPRVLPVWVSGGESFSVALASFQAVGAVVALSVVRQVLVLACVRVFPSRLRARVLGWGTLFRFGSPKVGVLSSTSAVVSFVMRLADISSYFALPTSDVFFGFVSVHSLCGWVVVMTTGKSWYDLVVT